MESAEHKFNFGDTVWVIKRDECVTDDYAGVMFLAAVGNCAICSPFINDYGPEETMQYHTARTADGYWSDLEVYALDDCYATKEAADKAVMEGK